MKNSFIGIIAIILLGFIAQSFLPWWSIALVGGLVGLFSGKNGLQSFLYGFVGALLLWGIYAWQLDAANESILSTRFSSLSERLSPFLLVLFTGFLGGLLGGLGAMTGTLGRLAFAKN